MSQDSKLDAEERRDTFYTGQFRKLTKFCEERLGWKIKVCTLRDCSGDMDVVDRVISIALRLRPELRVYTLLHEMGHVELWHEPDFQRRFPYSESFVESESKDSLRKRNRVCVLEEECAAWDRALRIAIRLKVRINRETFDRDKLRSLLSYVRAIDDN